MLALLLNFVILVPFTAALLFSAVIHMLWHFRVAYSATNQLVNMNVTEESAEA